MAPTDARSVAVRLSLLIDPSRTWPQMRALAELATTAGWHAIYTCDHFMPYDPDGRPMDGPVLEGWTTLAALAMCTTSARVGNLVLGNLYRHPAVVANMAATLDHVSGGRLILGIGAGWQVNEHDAFGIPLPPPSARIDQFEEACAVISSLLDRPRTNVAGSSYSIADAPCDPKPLQSHLPLLIGGGGERKTLRVVARYADVWHTWATPELFAHKSRLLDRYCHEVDRDPRMIGRANGGSISLSPRGAEQGPAPEPGIRGSTAEVIEALAGFAQAGVQEYVVLDDAAEVPVERALAQLTALTEGVLPHLPA
jgi:F420-dependent oxidoreductase-like protein